MPLTAFDHARRDSNKIALTFDDGPNPFYTGKILDILDEQNIKANFFVLGKWAELYPDILKETFDRGHLVGNHGYAHSKETGEFEKTDGIVPKITGKLPKFIKAPYFKNELTQNYSRVQKGEAMIANNDVVAGDWEKPAEDIFKEIINKTQNGSFILLHDGSWRPEEQETRPAQMFAALPKIISNLKEKFEFVRLDEMDFDI